MSHPQKAVEICEGVGTRAVANPQGRAPTASKPRTSPSSTTEDKPNTALPYAPALDMQKTLMPLKI